MTTLAQGSIKQDDVHYILVNDYLRKMAREV